MEGGSTAVRLASGNELCTIYSRPGKTGLKVELRRLDTAKEEFTSAGSVIIKGALILQSNVPWLLNVTTTGATTTGKKGSTKTDLVAAAYVENKAIIMYVTAPALMPVCTVCCVADLLRTVRQAFHVPSCATLL